MPLLVTPSQVERTSHPDHDDTDCIQEILSKFYLEDASESSESVGSEGGEECEYLESSDSERNSHTHCGKGELEAGELYDLYGDDEEEGDARSSTQDSDEYDDCPPEYSPTREFHGSRLPTRGQGWLHYDGSFNHQYDPTYTRPKPSKDIDVDVVVAIESPLSDYAGRPGSGEVGCGVDGSNPR